MALLSVNVNKIAVLRNSRGGATPSVQRAASTALAAGCGGITVHPRPDLRHIHPEDVFALKALVGAAEYNIEGNPFAPAHGQYPGFMTLIERVRPTQATLVPDGDGQITSDHGWDIATHAARLRPVIQQIRAWGVRVSLFVDSTTTELDSICELGADRIEIYTGPYAQEFLKQGIKERDLCAQLARRAAALGLGVNAGHDLNQENLACLLQSAPEICEVSIGHALICEALYQGLTQAVQRYLEIITDAEVRPTSNNTVGRANVALKKPSIARLF